MEDDIVFLAYGNTHGYSKNGIGRHRSHVSSPDWADIAPEMGPEQGDFVVTKRQWGAFYGTELDLQLRRRGIETIVLCGISTNIGVESTARFAYEYGYRQFFVEDAMSAMSEEEHIFTVTKIFPHIGMVKTTKEVIALLTKYIRPLQVVCIWVPGPRLEQIPHGRLTQPFYSRNTLAWGPSESFSNQM